MPRVEPGCPTPTSLSSAKSIAAAGRGPLSQALSLGIRWLRLAASKQIDAIGVCGLLAAASSDSGLDCQC